MSKTVPFCPEVIQVLRALGKEHPALAAYNHVRCIMEHKFHRKETDRVKFARQDHQVKKVLASLK